MAEKVLETTQGTYTVNDDSSVVFPQGIYAFEELRSFYILKMDDDNVFQLLQSEEKKDIAFIIINPYFFKKDYILNVREEDLHEIGIQNKEEAEKVLSVFAIVTVNDNSMTANLLGPVIINTEKKLGKQALALNEEYHTKHDILEELNSNKELREALGVSAG